MAIAYLNIGSNLGDRLANIERAVAAIERLTGHPAQRAPLEESEPWGFTSEHKFFNLGIAIKTELAPEALLELMQIAEQTIDGRPHRDSSGGYTDRAIDIDIVDYEPLAEGGIATERLTLPHPHLYEREFFLRPYLFLKQLVSEQ